MTPDEKQFPAGTVKLYTTEGYTIHVIRRRPDPIATRVSCGGDNAVAYCTYRGNLDDVILILRNSLRALVSLKQNHREPVIAADAGKEFS